MNTPPIARRLCLATTALFLVACAGPNTVPSSSPTTNPTPGVSTPSPAPTPTAPPATAVTSPAQAAALVFASDPKWAAIAPARPDMIGGSLSYEASEEADGYGVRITAGAGDCIAGCIMHRTWTYHVDPDGAVELVSEEGDEIAFDLPTGTSAPAQVRVTLTAGPVCPVDTNPPDPACAPRPVVNATVKLYEADGTELAEGVSDANGVVVFEVPAGAYYVAALPAEGLMGTPQAQGFAVLGGNSADLAMGYDTGIR